MQYRVTNRKILGEKQAGHKKPVANVMDGTSGHVRERYGRFPRVRAPRLLAGALSPSTAFVCVKTDL